MKIYKNITWAFVLKAIEVKFKGIDSFSLLKKGNFINKALKGCLCLSFSYAFQSKKIIILGVSKIDRH